MAPPRPDLARWVAPTTMALAGIGLAVSGYLFIEHLTASQTLACPENSVVNCQRVTTSEQASILGVPWALIGVLYFAAMLALVVPPAWRATSPAVARGRMALAAAGAVSVIYLVAVELFVVDAICLWCTVAHVVSLALFGLIALATADGLPSR